MVNGRKQKIDASLKAMGLDHMESLKKVEHIKDYGEHGFFPVFGGKM